MILRNDDVPPRDQFSALPLPTVITHVKGYRAIAFAIHLERARRGADVARPPVGERERFARPTGGARRPDKDRSPDRAVRPLEVRGVERPRRGDRESGNRGSSERYAR